MKSKRNKTIDITVQEGTEYLERCIVPAGKLSLAEITDATITGDMLQVMPLLPEKFIDLLIADPPYNLDKSFGGTTFRKMSDDDYTLYTDEWIRAVIPHLKDDASIYVCCDWKSSRIIETVLSKYFIIRNRITWQREKGRGSTSNWKNSMEDIWYATVSGKYKFNLDDVKMRRKVIAPYRNNDLPKDWEETPEGNFRDTCPSNFWDDISVPYWSMPENTAHPTQKPEKLIAKLILASSDEGNFVFDPFLGSGTTSVTAKKLGRHYAGIELDEQYCVWAEKRLEAAEEDKAIQGYTDGVFWERNTAALQNRYKKKE